MNCVVFWQLMALSTFILTCMWIILIWEKLHGVTMSAIVNPRFIVDLSLEFNNSSSLDRLTFYSSYHVKGFLRLPHSNLNEPIEVWYNEEQKKSRIDYYGGEVKTYQDGNLGLLVKIVPKYDSVTDTHSTGCWKKIKRGKVTAQTILPTAWSWPFKGTMESFKYVGDDYIRGKLCTKWKFSHKVYEKNNVYTFWVEKANPPVPVRYEMNGYDTLLTSYYDEYIIDYEYYQKWEYAEEIFKIPQLTGNGWCLNVSNITHHGDGGEFVLNPMDEFVSSSGDEDPMESEFHRYKENHAKVYDTEEHSKRKHVFRHNTRFIHSVNRQNRNFKLKLNSFADMTENEYNKHKGALPDNDDDEEEKHGKHSTRKFILDDYKPRKHSPEIPDELDWRKFGAVSKPRGQGTCGSCWAFAAVGALEGANFLKTGKLVELSEQQFMDCTWKVKGLPKNSGNSGCHGGWAWKAFFWARSNKIATGESYGPYKGQEGYCKTKNLEVGAKIYGFRRVKKWSAAALKRAVAYHGPAAVSINSRPLTLKFYSSGILDDKTCNNGTDHAVLVVGYGRENGTNYWLVKNSWSTMWGDEGYIKIKEDTCGVIKKPVVVYDKHIKHHPWMKEGRGHHTKPHHKHKSRHSNEHKHRDKHKHKHKHKHRHKHRRKHKHRYRRKHKHEHEHPNQNNETKHRNQDKAKPKSDNQNKPSYRKNEEIEFRNSTKNSWKGKWLSLGK